MPSRRVIPKRAKFGGVASSGLSDDAPTSSDECALSFSSRDVVIGDVPVVSRSADEGVDSGVGENGVNIVSLNISGAVAISS